MKVLGLDYGEKRIGLAVSDETKTLARELTILSPKDFFLKVAAIVSEHDIDSIALGYPLNMDGRPTAKTLEVERFETKLKERTKLPVYRVDERLTSSMAHKLPGGHKNVDSLAAQIILQNYLDLTKSSKL